MATVRIHRRAYVAPPALDGLHAAAAQVDITPTVGVSIGGFSVIAMERAEGCCGRLWSNILVLGEGTERVALVHVDLHAGSLYLTEKIAELLPSAHGLSVDRIVVLPSHTHNGPGGIYGFGMYDLRGSSKGGFLQGVADRMAARIARALEAACAALPDQPARVGVGRVPVWGVSANKSFQAFEANGFDLDALIAERNLGPVPPLPDRRYRAIDARVSVIWAERWDPGQPDAHGAPIGAIGFFGAHGATMSPLRGLISSESFGFAARRAVDLLWMDERLWGAGPRRRMPLGLAIGAGADVNVSAPDLLLEDMAEAAEHDDPVELPRAVAAELGRAIVQACWVARAAVRRDTGLSVHHRVVQPTGDQVRGSRRLSRKPQTGRVATGASEFGRFFLMRAPGGGVIRDLSLGIARMTSKQCPEGSSHQLQPDHPLHALMAAMDEEDPELKEQADDGGPQWPKVLMAKAIPEPVKKLLRGEVPDRVDVRVVKLGRTWLLTVPFEVTVGMGHALERALLDQGAGEVILGSICGGYTSYVATEAEYQAQYYEGSSVLWGRHTGAWLVNQAVLTASTAPAPPRPKTVAFKVNRLSVRPRGKDRPRPDLDFRAEWVRDLLRGSWTARRRDVPHFDEGPWVRLQVQGDQGWHDVMLAGAPVSDQQRGFWVRRKDRRRGLVRWQFEWPMPTRLRRRLRDVPVRMLLAPEAFTSGREVTVELGSPR